MSDTMTAFVERARQAHILAVERGEHDEQCEWGTTRKSVVLMLCHCSKRRRERNGFTTPPGPLIYNAPSCPRCYDTAVFNGDVWECRPCLVIWPDENGDAEFTDDYGDLSAPPPSQRPVGEVQAR
jgi:hypothetical protein